MKKEAEKENTKEDKMVFGIGKLKEIVKKELGSKAKIVHLDVEETAKGLKLSSELDAGFLGGKIILEGLIVNKGDELAVKNLKVDARGYVKSQIEANLSKFSGLIKKYFETKYDKQVLNISIEGSDLIVRFEK